MRKFTAVLFCLCLFASIAAAGPFQFQLGDVIASVGTGQEYVYRGGVLVTTLTSGSGYTTGSTTDKTGNVYVTNFSNGNVAKFDSNGNFVGTFAGGMGTPESILFDAAGSAFVGDASTNLIRKFDSAGNLLTSYTVATDDRGTDWIDLAGDQKTMYYTSEGSRIMRFDTSTSTQLGDFASLGGGTAYALRLLSGGGLLVADTADVKRLDSTGAVVQTYDVGSENTWFALNLDPNGTSFWSGDFGTGNLYEFDIATGALQNTINTGSSALFGVSVYGEITESGGGVNPVPEPGTLLLIASGLLGVGRTLRRKLTAV